MSNIRRPHRNSLTQTGVTSSGDSKVFIIFTCLLRDGFSLSVSSGQRGWHIFLSSPCCTDQSTPRASVITTPNVQILSRTLYCVRNAQSAAMVLAGQSYLFCALTLFYITGRILNHAQPFGKKGLFACDTTEQFWFRVKVCPNLCYLMPAASFSAPGHLPLAWISSAQVITFINRRVFGQKFNNKS